MAKWADYLISAVRYYNNDFISHLRIHEDSGDKVGAPQTWSKENVISYINNGYSFCTIVKNSKGNWSQGADVHVVVINGYSYLRTDKNKTPKDNLGNLPTF